jgi:hypothetical protein
MVSKFRWQQTKVPDGNNELWRRSSSHPAIRQGHNVRLNSLIKGTILILIVAAAIGILLSATMALVGTS